MTLSASQLKLLEAEIRTRCDAVAAELRDKVARAREESYAALAGRSADSGDLSLAALIAELGNADVDRQLAGLRELEDALRRVAEGRYGVCADCGADIAYERLRVQPGAKRCLACQGLRDHTHAHPTRARL